MLNDWAFYFITDERLTKTGILDDIHLAIRGGARVVQLRCKEMGGMDKDDTDEDSFLDLAWTARKMTEVVGVDLIINDNPIIASEVYADGLHLGQTDMPMQEARSIFSGIIGRSTHSKEQAKIAVEEGADYIAVGPIWATRTKPDAEGPQGLQLIREARTLTDRPLVAIGGIDLANVGEVIMAGADCACAISATVASDDVCRSVTDFEKLIRAITAKK